MGPVAPDGPAGGELAVVPDPPAPSADVPAAREALLKLKDLVFGEIDRGVLLEQQVTDLRGAIGDAACLLDAAVAGEPLDVRALRDQLRAALEVTE